MTDKCENCGEKVMHNEEHELVHVEPYDTKFPHRCNPSKVKK